MGLIYNLTRPILLDDFTKMMRMPHAIIIIFKQGEFPDPKNTFYKIYYILLEEK